MIVWWILVVIVFASWLGIVFVGAPYVPTKNRDLQKALKIAGLKKGELIVDLGSGDGRLLIEAARTGYTAVGYELNPFLVLFTWWRLRHYRPAADVRMVDFWKTPLPDETRAVFVFLAAPFMGRLEAVLGAEARRLGHAITLVSYGFEIRGQKPVRSEGSLLVYRFEP